MDNRQPQEIDLLKLAKVLLSRIWIILLITILFAGLAFGYTKFFVSPKYEAISKLYVFNTSEKVGGQVSSSDISTSKILVNTYIVILESDSVLGQVCDVIKEYQGKSGYEFLGDNEYTPERIRKMLSASSINNTESFEVVITATDPYEAKFINDAILYFLPEEIIRVVKAGAVEIIDKASIATEPCSPSISKNTVLGALLGFVISCGIIVVSSLMDTRIHSEDDVTENFKDIPIIGVIPSFHSKSSEKSNNGEKKEGVEKEITPSNDDDDDDDYEE